MFLYVPSRDLSEKNLCLRASNGVFIYSNYIIMIRNPLLLSAPTKHSFCISDTTPLPTYIPVVCYKQVSGQDGLTVMYSTKPWYLSQYRSPTSAQPRESGV